MDTKERRKSSGQTTQCCKTSKLYFEAHITIEPVFEEDLERVKSIAQVFGFRVADLLMQKRKEDNPSRSKYDTFCTGRSVVYSRLEHNTLNLVDILEAEGFKVWRYKIENTLLDSKINDSARVLANNSNRRRDSDVC